MDFVKTIIRVDDVAAFKQQCTAANFQNVLGRLKMNTAFIIAPRTKPKYFLINMDNLMSSDGQKIFNILMSTAQFIRDDSTPNKYWLVMFYLTSIEKSWNDQRMYYYEANKNRFQTILEFPCLSQNALTYVTEVAYYTKSPQGQNFALYRAGQNIITPLNEINPFQRIQTYINNLVPLQIVSSNGTTVFRSNTSPDFTTTTSPTGWTDWNNSLSMIWDNINFTMVYNMFFIVVPGQTFIANVTQGGFDYDPADNYTTYAGLNGVRDSQALFNLVSTVNNSTFFANIFNSVYPPGGLQGQNTLGSGSNMLMDLLTYWGILDNPNNTLQLNFYPIKTPIAITNVKQRTFPPTINGYLETFAFDPSAQFITMDLNPLLQDSILSLYEHQLLSTTFDDATTLVRLGDDNICNFLDIEKFGPFLRSEVYHFNMLQYSPYVEVFMEGIGDPGFFNFAANYQIAFATTKYVNFAQGYEIAAVPSTKYVDFVQKYEIEFANTITYIDFVQGYQIKSTGETIYIDFQQGYELDFANEVVNLSNTSDERVWNWYKTVQSNNFYQTQTQLTYTRNGPGTTGDEIIVQPNMSVRNQILSKYYNYSPKNGYSDLSLGKYCGWAEVKRGYVTNHPGVIPDVFQFVGLTYIDPVTEPIRFSTCPWRVGQFTVPSYLENTVQKLGMVVDGPIAYAPIEWNQFQASDWTVNFPLDCFTSDAILYKINDLGGGIFEARLTEFGQPTKTLPDQYGLVPMTLFEYLFESNGSPDGKVAGDYIVVIGKQVYDQQPKDNLPKIYFGINTNAAVWLQKQGLPTDLTTHVLSPSMAQGESFIDSNASYNSCSDIDTRDTTCQIGLPGRLMLRPQTGNPVSLTLDATLFFNITSNWCPPERPPANAWAILNVNYRSQLTTEYELQFNDQYFGYKLYELSAIKYTDTWDTRTGPLTLDRYNQVNFANIYPLKDVLIEFSWKDTPVGFAPTNYKWSLLPTSSFLSPNTYFNLILRPYIQYKEGKSYNSPDGNNQYQQYNPLTPQDMTAALDTNAFWLQFDGRLVDGLIEINFAANKQMQFDISFNRTFEQTISFDFVPPIDPWVGYAAQTTPLTFQWIRNVAEPTNWYLKFQVQQPSQPPFGTAAGEFYLIKFTNTTPHEPLNALVSTTVVDRKANVTPYLGPTLDMYNVPDISYTIPPPPLTGGIWYTDTQDEPGLMMTEIRKCATINGYNMKFENISGPPVSATIGPVVTLYIFAWQKDVSVPSIIYNRVVKAGPDRLSRFYFLNLGGVNIPPQFDAAFIRFQLDPKLDYFPLAKDSPPWTMVVTAQNVNVLEYARIKNSGTTDIFNLSTDLKPVIQSTEKYVLRIPSQPTGGTCMIQIMCVDFLAILTVGGVKYYRLVFENSTTEPLGANEVTINFNFDDFGWTPQNQWGYTIQVTILNFTGAIKPSYKEITATTDYSQIVNTGDIDVFNLATSWRSVTSATETYVVRVPTQPVGDRFILEIMCVDFLNVEIQSGITYYKRIFQNTTTEPLGANEVTVNFNFAQFGWTNVKQWGYTIQITVAQFVPGQGIPQYKEILADGSFAQILNTANTDVFNISPSYRPVTTANELYIIRVPIQPSGQRFVVEMMCVDFSSTFIQGGITFFKLIFLNTSTEPTGVNELSIEFDFAPFGWTPSNNWGYTIQVSILNFSGTGVPQYQETSATIDYAQILQSTNREVFNITTTWKPVTQATESYIVRVPNQPVGDKYLLEIACIDFLNTFVQGGVTYYKLIFQNTTTEPLGFEITVNFNFAQFGWTNSKQWGYTAQITILNFSGTGAPQYQVALASGDYAGILPDPDPDVFNLASSWKPVISATEKYIVRVPNQPSTDRFIILIMCVDLANSTDQAGDTYYKLIFQNTTTEPIGVDEISVNFNFQTFGWTPEKQWGYTIQLTILNFYSGDGLPQYQNSKSLIIDPNLSLFADSSVRTYIETPVTNVWAYYSAFLLANPQGVRVWIEFDLALYGGKRDYIWDQFDHICATTYKEADYPKISNQMVLCNACDNKGYGNVRNFLLYNRYAGEERYFWQKFVKKPIANFYISACPLASSTYYNETFLYSTTPVWDLNLNRYLTIYFK